jgi:hypothetical protein
MNPSRVSAWRSIFSAAIVLTSSTVIGVGVCAAQATIWPNMTIQGLVGNDQQNNVAVKQYDRFFNDPSFIGNSYDWSGVGQTFGNADWGTMISPTYFVSAAHHHPAIGQALTFYYTNSPNSDSSNSESRTIVSGTQIGTGDVWLGQLSAPVSSKVAKYPILNLDSNYNASYYQSHNPTIYTFGIGFPGSAPVGSNDTIAQRLGRNNIDFIHNDHVQVGGTPQNPVFEDSVDLWWDYNGGQGNSESLVDVGSSAAPDFVIMNVGGVNMPALVGTNFIRTDGNLGVISGSGSVLIPQYLNDSADGPGIKSEMVGEQPTLVGRWAAPNVVARKGDFSLDGSVNIADLQSMIDAMHDLSSYEDLHGLTDAYTLAMGDFNNDGKLTNADIQGLIVYIANGGSGSLTVVPEPAAAVLLVLGAWPAWRLAKGRIRRIGRNC